MNMLVKKRYSVAEYSAGKYTCQTRRQLRAAISIVPVLDLTGLPKSGHIIAVVAGQDQFLDNQMSVLLLNKHAHQ